MPQEPQPPLGWQGSGMGSRLTDLNRWPSLYNDSLCETHCAAVVLGCVCDLKVNRLINLLLKPYQLKDAD